jgi:hypothetical protein
VSNQVSSSRLTHVLDLKEKVSFHLLGLSVFSNLVNCYSLQNNFHFLQLESHHYHHLLSIH